MTLTLDVLQGDIWLLELPGPGGICVGERRSANFDDLVVVTRPSLTVRFGHLGTRRLEICAALDALADC